jgi:hypothetical protein
MTTKWIAVATLSGEPTGDQANLLMNRFSSTCAVDENTGSAQVTFNVDADRFDLAVRRALNTVLTDLGPALTSDPVGLSVVAPNAHAAALGVLSTQGVAERLGVSPARVRQLATQPDFPVAMSIPGLGTVFSTAAVELYRKNRIIPPAVGRPRNTDEEQLRWALSVVLEHSTTDHTMNELVLLSDADRHGVEMASSTTGGRYLRAKAHALVYTVVEARRREIRAFLDDDDRVAFDAAVHRAKEIMGLPV